MDKIKVYIFIYKWLRLRYVHGKSREFPWIFQWNFHGISSGRRKCVDFISFPENTKNSNFEQSEWFINMFKLNNLGFVLKPPTEFPRIFQWNFHGISSGQKSNKKRGRCLINICLKKYSHRVLWWGNFRLHFLHVNSLYAAGLAGKVALS